MKNMKNHGLCQFVLTLAVVGSCFVGGAWAGSAFVAVQDGKATADIVLAEKSHGVEQYAAEELA